MVLGGQPPPFCFYPLSRVTRIAKRIGTDSFEYSTQKKLHLTYLLPHRVSFAQSSYSVYDRQGKKLLFVNSVVKKHGVGWPPKTM